MVRRVALSKGVVAISSAGDGLTNPEAIAASLVASGWLMNGQTTPTKRKPISEPAVGYARPARELVSWEIGRRDWICEYLVRHQAAYEMTRSSMIDYRASGVVQRVEVLTRDCCKACRARYPIAIPVNTNCLHRCSRRTSHRGRAIHRAPLAHRMPGEPNPVVGEGVSALPRSGGRM